MKIILLGAGASKAYSESPTGQRMPIAKDFFSTYDSLEISSNIWVLIGDILNLARDELGIDYDEFFTKGIDIEEFHSFVEQKLLAVLHEFAPKHFQYWKAYLQLVFLFSSVVNEIQNGPASKAHKSLASILEPEDIVLTFNWDTLMDRALSENTDWCADYGYGVKPKGIFRNKWEPPTEIKNYNGPFILKLHGSSNWITSYPQVDPDSKQIALSQTSSPETLYIYENTNEPYATYAGRFLGPYQPFSYFYYPPNLLDDSGKPAPDGHLLLRLRVKFPWDIEGLENKNGLPTMPLIIPPVKEKNYNLFGSLFENIWSNAERCITKTDLIVIIGYSFPRTDLKSIDLFRQAFMKRKSMPNIIVVNPAPEPVVDLLRNSLGITDDHIRIIREYFTDSFDVSRLEWA